MLQIGIRVWLCSPCVKVLGHACMSIACVSLTLAFHVFIALHHVDHDYSKVVMRKLMLICGMDHQKYMTGCIWLYVTYMLIICHLTTSLYVRCILECFDYTY